MPSAFGCITTPAPAPVPEGWVGRTPFFLFPTRAGHFAENPGEAWTSATRLAVLCESTWPLAVVASSTLERLRDVFADVAPGTVAEGATLFAKVLPFRHYCQNCGCDFEASRTDCPCPECGHPHTEIRGGEELRLHEVELDDSAA